MIYVSAESESATPRLKDSLNRLMRERRRIPADADEDFSVKDLKEISELIEQTTGVLNSIRQRHSCRQSIGRWDRHHEYNAGNGDRTHA